MKTYLDCIPCFMKQCLQAARMTDCSVDVQKEFVDIFNSADMIISKGQGNYETLSDKPGPLFFLLMAKCPVIAEHAGCKLKDILLIKA
jgi:uncharacterized protein with ATP-grasp and redox domains